MKKQILPLALALTLVLSLAVPAMAAETVTLTKDGPMDTKLKATLTGVLSQEISSWAAKELWPTQDENGNSRIEEQRTDQIENETIYTVSRDFTVTGKFEGTDGTTEVDLRTGGFWSGYRLSQDGTYETIGFSEGSTYYLFNFSATPGGNLMQETTQEDFFTKGDLYSLTPEVMGVFAWIRFADNGSDIPTPAVPTVAPVANPATLDGKPITLNAYLFTEGSGGTNYVMLRDVAQLLNGSKAQFEVTWDKNKGIIITTGQAYTSVGNELQGKGDGNKAYTANASTITINGKAVELTAYTIDGNNYFKLRDLGAALNFNVSWDKDKGVTIDSNAPYSGEK